MSGETGDISEFALFNWYEWLTYRDEQVTYPNNNFVLVRYLGPSFDIGPAMTAKLFTKNGTYIHRSTIQALADDEKVYHLEEEERIQFGIAVKEKVGDH